MQIDSKLKKELKEKLLSFYEKFCSKDDFVDLELLNLMAYITTKTGFEVAVFVNRKGQVVDIYVGTQSSVSFPSFENTGKGFCGVRVIHTHPNGNSELSKLDKSALINNKFDCVCAVGVNNGELTTATAGFIKPDGKSVVTVFMHNANYINKYGLIEKIKESEKEFVEQNSKLIENQAKQYRAVLVAVELSKEDNLERDINELKGLSATLQIEVVGVITQKRSKPDNRYLIGEGKLEELRELIQNTQANLVIFDNVLSGSKQSNLTKTLGVEIIDRSRLILEIFAKRAQSSEGKLQVELARLKYLLPRSANMIKSDGGGSGIGLKGPGESKVELNRRIIENNILKLERELENVKKTRAISRDNRLKSNKPIVSLVGYTNSGKSTLMNVLSGANVYEKDELFATLDTTTRNVWLANDTEILLIDTVGFINKLPHEFINAFSSTLEESVYADLLLLVVDASDKDYQNHIKVVHEVLKKIKANSPIITVFNKIDKVKNLDEIKQTAPQNSIFISAKKYEGIEELKKVIIKNVKKIKK